MQVIPVGVELHNPNVCTICEERPEGPIIDTERWTPFNPSYPLNGRKYICARCGDEIARLFGYQSTDAVAQAAKDSLKLESEIADVRNKVLALANELTAYITGSEVNAIRVEEPQIALPTRKEQEDAGVLVPDVEVVDTPAEPEETETRSYEEVFGEPEPAAPKKARRTKSTVESKSESK